MKKKTAPVGPITCTIGETTVIEGTFTASEATRIDGKITGDVKVDGALTIGEKGEINGDVTALSLITAGKITGNIKIDDSIEILSTASIRGDIACKTMVMDENAFFEGNCKMNRSEE